MTTENNSESEMARFGAWIRQQLSLSSADELEAAVQAAEREVAPGLPDRDPWWQLFEQCTESLKLPKGEQQVGLLRARALEIVRLRRGHEWQSKCREQLSAARAHLAKVKPLHTFVESRLTAGLSADLQATAATLGEGDIARAAEAFSAACAAVRSAAEEADKSARASVAGAQAEFERAPTWLKEASQEAA